MKNTTNNFTDLYVLNLGITFYFTVFVFIGKYIFRRSFYPLRRISKQVVLQNNVAS